MIAKLQPNTKFTRRELVDGAQYLIFGNMNKDKSNPALGYALAYFKQGRYECPDVYDDVPDMFKFEDDEWEMEEIRGWIRLNRESVQRDELTLLTYDENVRSENIENVKRNLIITFLVIISLYVALFIFQLTK